MVVQQRWRASARSTVAAMAGVFALVRRGEESRRQEMKWKQQQHVAWFIYFGTASRGQQRRTGTMQQACTAHSRL